MNYIITTPEEGFIIGMISGSILFGILYNVFVQNNKKYEDDDDSSESSNESDENSDVKTEASETDLYTDTFVNIRDHIVFSTTDSNNHLHEFENKDESSESESNSESESEDSDEEIIDHNTILLTENKIYEETYLKETDMKDELNLSEN